MKRQLSYLRNRQMPLLSHTDTLILGRVMYPDYEQYWLAVLANPAGVLPFSGRQPTKNEIAYARLADRTPHLVVSRTLDKVAWKTSRIVRDVEEIRQLKQRPGKDMQVVGGATLVSSLMKAGHDVLAHPALNLGVYARDAC